MADRWVQGKKSISISARYAATPIDGKSNEDDGSNNDIISGELDNQEANK